MRKNIFFRSLLVGISFMFWQQTASAQFEEGREETIFGLPALNGAGIFATASNTATYTNSSEDSNHIRNIITFKINENSNVSLLSSFTATVYLKLKTKINLGSSYDSVIKTLTVNYDNTAGAKYNVRAYLILPKAEVVTMIIDSIHVSSFTGGWSPIDVLQLENEMRILRYFTLSSNPTYLAPSFSSAVDDSDAVHVSWTWNALTNNNMTQLEWAWVEDSAAAVYTGTDSLFANNSTRVDLDYLQDEYKIPLLYDGEGKLYYRVRAVERRNNGTLVAGPWSNPQNFDFEGHEPDMNWQSSTSFAENGKFKTVIQYFDGSLRSRQTVTKDNTTGNTVVAETIYDLQGRPNIQILPTPTINNTIQYFRDFNRFLGQHLDGGGVVEDPAKYFDLTPAAVLCTQALSLDSNYGNGKYYSNKNPWLTLDSNAKYIPDAKGYAYTETRFMDDATGRVSRQGGVGIDLQIGSGRETKYYYGKPAQQELDALFATEVGDASHYSKNMVRDANGQMSVSYVDMHGRPIATALAGDTTTGISTIISDTSDYPLTSGTLTNQFSTPVTNVINGNSIESISTILVPATTVFNFTYKLDPSILSINNCSNLPVCFDCKYDLEISIKSEECGDTTPIVRRYSNLQIMPSGSACDTSRGFTGESVTNVKTINFTQTLGIGSWVIRKTLTINDSMYQVRKDSALKAFLCKTEQQIYDSIYAILYATSGCGITPSDTAGCSNCLVTLGTSGQYRTKYLTSIGLDSSDHSRDVEIALQFTKDSTACANICGALNVELTTLQSLRYQMLNDMIPFNGQYAIDSVRDPVTEVATALTSSMAQSKYNIFTTAPSYGSYTKPFYKHPLNENGQAKYYTEEMVVDSIIHRHDESGQQIVDTVSRDVFSSLFQHSWASSLIKYHPEYSKLRIAQDSLKRSYEWLDSMQAIDDYATAASLGFTNPLSLPSASSHPDPFFQKSNNSLYKDTMDKRIRYGIRIDGSGVYEPTIWQLANSDVLCAGIDSTLKGICTTNLPAECKTGISPAITETAEKNRVWQSFRAMYLGYRNEMVLKYINGKSGVLTRAGMDSLLAEGKQLVFANMNDIATWKTATSWYTKASAGDTTHLSDSVAIAVNTYSTDKCLGQKPFWKARLLQCEALITKLNNKTHSDSVAVNTIIDSILVGMVSVCNNSKDAQHYFGASNVKPSYAGNPKDFERVINPIFKANGIDTVGLSGYFCNPYSIDFPKPYGKNPPLFTNTVNVIDTCGCSRFATIKTEALAASVDTSSFSSMNSFLLTNYGDTISNVLWEGLRKCRYITACDPNYIPKFNSDGCDTTTWFLSSSTAFTNKWVKYKDIFQGGVVHIPDSVYSHVTSGLVADSIAAKTYIVSRGKICVADSFIVNYRLKTRAFSGAGAKLIIVRVNLLPSNVAYLIYIGQDPVSGTGGLYKGGEGTPPLYTTASLNNYFSDFKKVTLKFANSTLKIYIDGSYIFQRPVTETGTTGITTSIQFTRVDGSIDYVNLKKLPDSSSLYDETFATACSLFTNLNKSGYKKVVLPDYVTFPAFLNCGYTKPCITCGKLDSLTTEFRAKFPTFSSTPYLDSSITESQSKENNLWARFLNYRTGFSKTTRDYMNAYYNCHHGTPPVYAICSYSKPLNDPSDVFIKDTLPCKYVQTQAEFIAQLLYQKMKDSLLARFDSLYKANCFNAKSIEQFYATYQPKEYHYTLYSYDQAGNLVKTIPPAGVKPNFDSSYLAGVVSARAGGTDVSTNNNDSLATFYKYNSLNQVVSQRTPDAGVSKFWYDRLGRLVVSQNAKQWAYNQYSYTLYDELGRITEVGQSTNSTAMTQTISRSPGSLAVWIANVGAGTKKQITQTVYDIPYTSVAVTLNGKSMLYQKNLRNRVSYTMLFDDESQRTKLGDSTWSGGNSATYYSYDIHGNVDTLLQDYNLGMGSVDCDTNGMNRFKKMVYYYDLVSGKVNDVAYQPGEPDAFYHRYQYDAENRITAVKTSKDKIYWEQDASYSYYRHGPLAKTVLGQNQVQGLDYAYTIHGWLKGVNSTSVGDAEFDIGNDGKVGYVNSLVARDAYGFSLNYFTGEYKPISTGVTPFTTVPLSLPADPVSGVSTGQQLFNGNIAAMAVNIAKFNAPMVYGYRYDQLNRIVRMDAFTGINNSANSFTASRTDDYHEKVSYDPNGNIRTYLRHGTTQNSNQLQMDSMQYEYISNTNKLKRVTDGVNSAYYSDDIDNQVNSTNYSYDQIGNLIEDKAEGIDSIKWTVYGKISHIYKSGTVIQYAYDASGNRISKAVTVSGNTNYTYYVRDASGNVMSVYQRGDNALAQTEIHLYGSNRLGIYNVNVNVQCPAEDTNLVIFTRGNKFFELSNHLGNVLVTVSDKHIGVDDATWEIVCPCPPPGEGEPPPTCDCNLTKTSDTPDGIIDYYTAEVVTANDYYPFGMSMFGRKFTAASGYRYGFNGKENDKDAGEGIQDYGKRIYDVRLGKFLSVDPLYKDYPWNSTYAFAENDPINYIDLDGAEKSDPPLVENNVYFIQLFSPWISSFCRNDGESFTGSALEIDTEDKTEYTINAQQYEANGISIPQISPTSNSKWTPQGQTICKGHIVTGKSSPETFFTAVVGGERSFGKGDPPPNSEFAIGGGIPVIINGLKYGEKNIYKEGAPLNLPEVGDPGMENMKYLSQRSNKGYPLQDIKSIGKSILATNSTTGATMIIVQENGVDGMTLTQIRDKLITLGYDNAISFDGSTSATLVKDEKVLVAPSNTKNNATPSGLTFKVDPIKE